MMLREVRKRRASESVRIPMDSLDWIAFREALFELISLDGLRPRHRVRLPEATRTGLDVPGAHSFPPPSLMPLLVMDKDPRYAVSRVLRPEAIGPLVEALSLLGKLDGVALPDWITMTIEEPGPPTPLVGVDDGGSSGACRGPGSPSPLGGSRGGAAPMGQGG